jgi:GT2 family glycosyltransferase
MGYFDGQSSRPVDQPMASCLLVRREVFDRVGLFDESYPMFFNDVDWCKRVKDAGHAIWYTPDVKVGHIGGATVKKYRSKMIWMSHHAYFRYLLRSYADNSPKLVLTLLPWPLLMLAALLRSIWHSVRG